MPVNEVMRLTAEAQQSRPGLIVRVLRWIVNTLAASYEYGWDGTPRLIEGEPLSAPQPTFILAQMICAEILEAPEFRWTRDPLDIRQEEDARRRLAETRSRHEFMADYGYVYDYHRPERFIFSTKKITLYRTVERGDVRLRLGPVDEIDWTRTRPCGKDFTAKEKAMILAAIAKAQELQKGRDDIQAEFDRQQRAVDALANWMGVIDELVNPDDEAPDLHEAHVANERMAHKKHVNHTKSTRARKNKPSKSRRPRRTSKDLPTASTEHTADTPCLCENELVWPDGVTSR